MKVSSCAAFVFLVVGGVVISQRNFGHFPAIRQNPFLEAEYNEKNGKIKEALTSYTRYAALETTDPFAFAKLALLYARLGCLRKSEASLRLAIQRKYPDAKTLSAKVVRYAEKARGNRVRSALCR